MGKLSLRELIAVLRPVGRKLIVEKSTLAPCIGTRRPIPPNRCDTCRKHSYITCDDIKFVVSGDGRVVPVQARGGEARGGGREGGETRGTR